MSEFLTVFTPTFNRAHTLARTYSSLLQQDCKDFIWLIVDDGSQDGTGDMVSLWQQQKNGFQIEYIYKKNGGMHTAHNIAYENIHTELNVCIDSDDRMAPGAVRKIKETWEKIDGQKYAGIIALDSDFQGNIIGKDLSSKAPATTLAGYYAQGGTGDKKLIYRTDVICSVPPYPVFENEKYVGLAYKYTLVDQKYKLYILNEVICEVEYQADGSSSTMWTQYLKNPNGFAFLRTVNMKYPSSFNRLVLDCIHYCSSCQIAQKKHYVLQAPRPGLTALCVPIGWLLTCIVYKKAGRFKGLALRRRE